ncbi:transcription elongation factor, partial [Methylobacterium frigidaeris]
MSIAFVREKEGGEAFEDLPDRPVSPHPNFVTPEGLALIDAELDRLHIEHAGLSPDDKANMARVNRDLRYW